MSRPTTPSSGLDFPVEPDTRPGAPAEGRAPVAPPLRLVSRMPGVGPDTVPLPAPGATFETRRLVAIGGERLELVPTWQERVFLGLFFGFAAALAAIGASRLGATPDALIDALAATPAQPPAWPPLLAALVLALVAVAVARAGGRTVLDGRTRQFRRTGGALSTGGWRSVDRQPAAAAVGSRRGLDRVNFDELVGVQRLACRIADEEVRWTIHQVNLVMRDGSRVHVCSHVEEALARRTAETVARFIGVEIMTSVAQRHAREGDEANEDR